MKPTHAFALLLSASLPLGAAEPQKEAKPESKQESKVEVAQLSPEPEKLTESPLVAAAKRANRLGKKPAFIITNATVAQSASASDVHVTTTTNQRNVNIPPAAPSREAQMAANQALDRQAVEKAAEKKKREEAEKARRPPAYDDAESLYGDPNRPDAGEPVPPPDKKPDGNA